jgi:cell division protein FtsZ
MAISFQIPQKHNLKPTITVVGVGGAGGNAVNNMIANKVEGVKFVVANTDAQALEESLCENRIQLGTETTQGLGAGSYPEVGRASAEESAEELLDYIQGSNMIFITAGMGGGTGTGAAPIVARIARELGILTVGVVTKPFHFEGTHRMRVAELGLQELQKYVDTMIIIPNQNLFRIADKSTTFMQAFKMADGVLKSGVCSITDLMTMPGLINLDFADVRSVMSEMGKAMMGTGEADGDSRAVKAAEAAIANPLLDNVSMKGAKGVLINISGGDDLTLFELDEAANKIREEVDENANIIFGSTFDPELGGKIRVSVVATGIDQENVRQQAAQLAAIQAQQAQAQEQADFEDEDERELPEHGFIPQRVPSEPSIEQQSFARSEGFSQYGRAQQYAPTQTPPVQQSTTSQQRRTEDAQANSGLFGSLFNKKDNYERAESVNKVINNTASSLAQPQTQNKPATKEDDLEVPAFLRRKVNN